MSLDFDDGDEIDNQHEPPELPITAMIDVFSMIVIFLLLGGAFGSSDIKIPKGTVLAKSVTEEAAIAAPQVHWTEGGLDAEFVSSKLDEAVLREGGGEVYESFKNKLKTYLGAMPAHVRTSQKPVNLVADAGTPYETVFRVIKLLREAGFENVLLVSSPQ